MRLRVIKTTFLRHWKETDGFAIRSKLFFMKIIEHRIKIYRFAIKNPYY